MIDDQSDQRDIELTDILSWGNERPSWPKLPCDKAKAAQLKAIENLAEQ